MRPQDPPAKRNDLLDAAIDQVAARMVAVQDDPDMTLRIVGALPARSSRLGWLIPQFAALGALVVAAVLWSTRDQPATPIVLPSTEIAAVAAFPNATEREPGTRTLGTLRTLGTQPSEPAEPSEPSEPLADFARSLPALELSAIGPQALPVAEPLTLEPIEIGELPLTATTISLNKF